MGVVKQSPGTIMLLDHHEKKREYGGLSDDDIRNMGNHGDFDLMQGDKQVGDIRVSAFSVEHRIYLEDDELGKQFAEEIKEMQREHGYGPFMRR